MGAKLTDPLPAVSVRASAPGAVPVTVPPKEMFAPAPPKVVSSAVVASNCTSSLYVWLPLVVMRP